MPSSPLPDIHFRRERAGSRTILILHGWGSHSGRWQPDIALLGRAGYDVVVPDLPGFGESPPPPAAWGVDDYAAAMRAFLRHFDIHPFLIIGHSFGGRVAIRLLLHHPEAARGLVLCASSGLKHPRTLKQRLANLAAKAGGALFSIKPLTGLQDLARRALYRGIGEHDYYRTAGVMRETFLRVIEEDIAPGLDRLSHPTLIVWGDQDRVTPLSDAHRFHRLIPNARLEIIPGAGHRLPYEQPEIFCKLVTTFADEFGIG